MLFLVDQAFVGRDERQAPLKMAVWEANPPWVKRDNVIQT